MDVYTNEYDNMKKQPVWHEMILLRSFGFICHVDHPHKMLLSMLQMLRQPGVDMQGLTQEAWNLVCDSLRTTICVRFKSETVACAVIYYATRKLGVSAVLRGC